MNPKTLYTDEPDDPIAKKYPYDWHPFSNDPEVFQAFMQGEKKHDERLMSLII